MAKNKTIVKADGRLLSRATLSIRPVHWEAAKLLSERCAALNEDALSGLLGEHAAALESLAAEAPQRPSAMDAHMASAPPHSGGHQGPPKLEFLLRRLMLDWTCERHPAEAAALERARGASDSIEFLDEMERIERMKSGSLDILSGALLEIAAGADAKEAIHVRGAAKAAWLDPASERGRKAVAAHVDAINKAEIIFKALNEATLASMPPAWLGLSRDVGYAVKTSATVAQAGFEGLESDVLESLLAASRGVHALRAQAALIAKTLPKLAKRAAKEGWPDAELMAIRALDLGCQGLAREAKGALGPDDKVEIESPDSRFAPRAAYGIYVPPGAARLGPRGGFWHSSEHPNADISEAKLFDSPARAKKYFASMGARLDGWALVEVAVAPTAILECKGSANIDAIRAELARTEAAKLRAEIEKMEIHHLRARLAQLEGPSPGASEAAATAKKKRL